MSSSEEDGQFAGIWASAVEQYFTNIDCHDRSAFATPSSTESLMQELGEHHSQFTEFQAKRGALFSILMKSMKPVELVGNMAAGAASGAFPPSSMIFGAVTYLINAAKGVSAAYDSIIELFSKLQEYTKRLEIYLQNKISGTLRLKLAQILAVLLEIYALSAKIIHDGRFKKYFKVILLGRDEKVAAALTKLDKLMDNERGLVLALALTGVGNIKSGVDDLKSANANTHSAITDMRESVGHLAGVFDTLTKKLEGDASTKQDEKIRLALRPEPTVQDIYDGLADILEGSGKWIQQEPLFHDWKTLVNPLVFLSGGPGSGKSYISYSILQHLQELHPQGVQDPSRVSVAYFFCKDYNPNLRSFNTLLRTVAYQITKNDPVYAKYVAGICSFPDDIRSTRSLWKKLFTDFFRKTPVYIIIDGLDESFKEDREEFLQLLTDYELPANSDGKLKIQIMFLGRPELGEEFDSILETVPLIEVSAKKNTSDINDYIHHNIRKSKKLRKVSGGLRQEILEKLSQYADGMFLYVNLMIKEIQSKDREAKIIETLKNLPKGLLGTLRHVLERFSEELDEYQIDDLNEMLAWVTCARRPLTLGELQIILKLKSADGLGMIDLESKIRKRYASFFVLMRKDGKTTEELQAQLHRLSITTDSEDEESDLKTQPVVSNRGSEVIDDESEETDITSDPVSTIVRMSHASLGDFFRSKDQQVNVAVGVNINNAELALAKSCLASICDESKWSIEGGRTLNFYAISRFQNHLGNVDISLVKVEDKLQVFNYLKQLFHDQAVTKRWLQSASWMRNNWLFSDQSIATIRKWLTDTDVEKSLDSADAAWVKEVGSGNSGSLLKPAAMMFAKIWLQDVKWNPIEPFLFVHGYLEKMDCDGKLPVKITASAIPADRFYHVAKWPQFEETAIWHARLGRTLREAGHIDDAIKSFEKAISLDNTLGLAFGGLGFSHVLKHNYKEAFNSVIKAQDFLQDPKFKATKAYNYKRLANWSEELNKYDDAVKYYAKSVDLNSSNYDTLNDYLIALGRQSQFKEMIEFLRKLDGEIIQPSGNSRLIELFLYFAKSLNFNETMRTLARQTDSFQQAENLYKRAIKAAKIKGKEKGKEDMLAALRHWLAYLYCREMKQEEKAVQLWKKVINDPEVALNEYNWIKEEAAEQLSIVYFNRALDDKTEVDKYASLIEEMTKMKVVTHPDDDPVYSILNTTLLLGSWYRINGREQDAKACFKEHVMLAFDALTDDEDNDTYGWYQMARVLIAVVDDVNANAALSVLQQWEPKESDDEDESAEREGKQSKKDEGEEEAAQGEVVENKPVDTAQDADQNNGTARPDNQTPRVGETEDRVPLDSSEVVLVNDEAESMESKPDEISVTKEVCSVDKGNMVRGETPNKLPDNLGVSDQSVSQTDGSKKTDSPDSTGKATSLDIGAEGKPNAGGSDILIDNKGEDNNNDETDTKTASKDDDNSNDEITWRPFCDGPCDQESRLSTGFHFCRYCVDIGFCNACIKIVRAGEMPFNVCHPKHEHFYFCRGQEPSKKGTIRVAGKVVPLEEWLESVKREWAD